MQVTSTEDIVPCCSICGSGDMDDLGMIPSLNSEGKVIAFIFVCSKHFDKVAGLATSITFGKPVAPATWNPKGIVH